MRRFSFAAAAMLLALWLPGPAHAVAAVESLSKEDRQCLECHAKPALATTMADGKSLPLYIAPRSFAESVHADSGCEACHADVDLDSHAKAPQKIESRRAHALAVNEACRDCHKKTVKLYEDSVHAALVRDGSAKAPLCADCHDPHATRPVKQAAGGEPTCARCHEGIVRAHAQSVHGLAGADGPVCKDCHRSHDIKAATMNDNIRDECLACHQDAPTTHATWLPNTARHLEAISCPACHTPGAQRRVNLRVYTGGAQQRDTAGVGVPQFVKLTRAAGAGGEGLDARALWSLLQDFSRGASAKTPVRGRLEVIGGEAAHALGDKTTAESDCANCHAAGAEPFKSVTITMAGPDGRPVRHEARPGLLTSVESIESVGGFYAIGGTRIKLLDTLLLLALAGGIGIPLGHLAMRRFFKRPHAATEGTDRSES
jgi:hypothetical protein